MNVFFKIIIVLIFFISNKLLADEASVWLKKEIDVILDAYKISSISSQERFNLIEDTINKNFAGSGIAKFVAGKAWGAAPKDIKKEYIKTFKKHLALNIASMMQGYSNQEYELINSKHDDKNNVYTIDMSIKHSTGNLLVTWRVKKSKNRFFVIDLLVADISLVVTKRSEFHSLLKKVDYNLKQFNEILIQQNEISLSRLIN